MWGSCPIPSPSCYPLFSQKALGQAPSQSRGFGGLVACDYSSPSLRDARAPHRSARCVSHGPGFSNAHVPTELCPCASGCAGAGPGRGPGGHGAAPGVCVADGQPGQGGPCGHFMTHPVSGCGASQTEDRRSPRARGQRKRRPRRPSTGFSHGRDRRWRPRPQEAGPPASPVSAAPARGPGPGRPLPLRLLLTALPAPTTQSPRGGPVEGRAAEACRALRAWPVVSRVRFSPGARLGQVLSWVLQAMRGGRGRGRPVGARGRRPSAEVPGQGEPSPSRGARPWAALGICVTRSHAAGASPAGPQRGRVTSSTQSWSEA